MRYSLEPSYRKYVQGQGFMSFAKNIGNKYGRKIFDKSIDVSNKYGRKILDKSMDASKDFAKIAGKKVLHKSAEATGEMTVCSYHVKYTFQSGSTLYSCLNFKELLAIECGFTLKRVRDMIRTYSQMHRTDKYSQHSSIIWPVWQNGSVFVCELSGCGFESSCSHLKTSDFAPASSKEFLDIQATIECGFTLKRVRDMIKTYSQMHRTDKYSQHSSIIWAVWLNG